MPAPAPDRSVLFLLSSLTMGGSERKTVRLANALAARSYRPVVAYLNGPRTLLTEIDDAVPVACLHRRGKFSISAMRQLLRLVRDAGVRTVVAVNLYAALYAVLAKVLMPRGRLRVCVSINTTEFVTGKEARQMLLYRWVLRGADKLIFGAEAQRALWCERYGLGRPDSHIVLYNGVETEHFDPARVEAAEITPRPAPLLITVGRLGREKGHVDLIRAVGMLRAQGIEAGALLVGEGPQRALIEAEIARLGLGSCVRLVGETADVRPFLAAADLFVLPSIAVETFSNAALEAMSMGVPLVASDMGGIREMLAFGGGITYPPGDVATLVGLVSELWRDAAARGAFGRQARLAAIERFGWQKLVDTFAARVMGEVRVTAGTDVASATERAVRGSAVARHRTPR
jgi:glycosyltransferase involved in cell wall biosynthesis